MDENDGEVVVMGNEGSHGLPKLCEMSKPVAVDGMSNNIIF